MKIIVNGAGGKMGRVLCDMINADPKKQLAASVSLEFDSEPENNVYKTIDEFCGEADCIIDFSHHTAAVSLCAYAVKNNIPVVIATTGHTDDELAVIKTTAKQVPVFLSANMSLGVSLVCSLASQAAKAFPDADIEIVEKHHNQKLDVPSGTALLIANAIKDEKPDGEFLIGRHENGKRSKNEIGIHSLRIGSEVGTHEVIFATGSQVITIKHEAKSRSLFAEGALTAADFLCGKQPGLYNMKDILK